MNVKGSKPLHGGDLARAEREFGVPVDGWLDLSTGISPWAWPVPAIPESVWRTLPGDGASLKAAAAAYYGLPADHILPVPGSQLAIQQLPTRFRPAAVAIPRWGYAEHRLGWQRAGHDIVHYHSAAELRQLVDSGRVHFVVAINPNNPTAERLEPQWLLAVHQQLQRVGGWLIVDEAFMDTSPEHSLAPHCPLPGLVVLRSPGKFFGLAGLRLGFVLAPAPLLNRLAGTLSPWLVSHPALWLGERALLDGRWQDDQRQRLQQASAQWQQQLQGLMPTLNFTATPLFVTGVGSHDHCRYYYQQLGQQGVLVRLFDDIEGDIDSGNNRLRFGLPGNDRNAQRVAAILKGIKV